MLRSRLASLRVWMLCRPLWALPRWLGSPLLWFAFSLPEE